MNSFVKQIVINLLYGLLFKISVIADQPHLPRTVIEDLIALPASLRDLDYNTTQTLSVPIPGTKQVLVFDLGCTGAGNPWLPLPTIHPKLISKENDSKEENFLTGLGKVIIQNELAQCAPTADIVSFVSKAKISPQSFFMLKTILLLKDLPVQQDIGYFKHEMIKLLMRLALTDGIVIFNQAGEFSSLMSYMPKVFTDILQKIDGRLINFIDNIWNDLIGVIGNTSQIGDGSTKQVFSLYCKDDEIAEKLYKYLSNASAEGSIRLHDIALFCEQQGYRLDQLQTCRTIWKEANGESDCFHKKHPAVQYVGLENLTPFTMKQLSNDLPSHAIKEITSNTTFLTRGENSHREYVIIYATTNIDLDVFETLRFLLRAMLYSFKEYLKTVDCSQFDHTSDKNDVKTKKNLYDLYKNDCFKHSRNRLIKDFSDRLERFFSMDRRKELECAKKKEFQELTDLVERMRRTDAESEVNVNLYLKNLQKEISDLEKANKDDILLSNESLLSFSHAVLSCYKAEIKLLANEIEQDEKRIADFASSAERKLAMLNFTTKKALYDDYLEMLLAQYSKTKKQYKAAEEIIEKQKMGLPINGEQQALLERLKKEMKSSVLMNTEEQLKWLLGIPVGRSIFDEQYEVLIQFVHDMQQEKPLPPLNTIKDTLVKQVRYISNRSSFLQKNKPVILYMLKRCVPGLVPLFDELLNQTT